MRHSLIEVFRDLKATWSFDSINFTWRIDTEETSCQLKPLGLLCASLGVSLPRVELN